MLHQQNVILKPRWAGNKNRYRCQGTFVFTVLPSKFAFWVNLHPCYGCQGCKSFLVGVKGRYWSQISHRKLNISIWVPSILVKSPKDHLLRNCAVHNEKSNLDLGEHKYFSIFSMFLYRLLHWFINDRNSRVLRLYPQHYLHYVRVHHIFPRIL